MVFARRMGCRPHLTIRDMQGLDKPAGRHYARDMENVPTSRVPMEVDGGRHDAIGGVLASALNMEEEIGKGVYQDYLKAQNWPPELDKEAFLQIRKRLTLLIQGTERHKKTLHALSKDYDPDRNAV